MQPGVSQFILNNRFYVDVLFNKVRDRQTDKETRLEPRLMKLLCLLAENAGQPVDRERIIQEIWDNYGGADEGLTQAISFLRKAFDDAGRDIIQTIPKKGYILVADISYPEPGSGKKRNTYTRTVYLFIFIAIIIGAVVFYMIRRGNDQGDSDKRSGPFEEPEGTIVDSIYQYKEMQEQSGK